MGCIRLMSCLKQSDHKHPLAPCRLSPAECPQSEGLHEGLGRSVGQVRHHYLTLWLINDNTHQHGIAHITSPLPLVCLDSVNHIFPESVRQCLIPVVPAESLRPESQFNTCLGVHFVSYASTAHAMHTDIAFCFSLLPQCTIPRFMS